MRFRLPLTVFNDDRGNVAIIAALCILPITLAAGMAVDLSNATRTKLALQDATDSAALAIARNASSISDASLNAAAANYVDASYDKKAVFSITTATIDRSTLTVTVNAKANVPTTFAALLGKSSLPVGAHSVVKGQGFDYEIALVLDNSGSMSSSLGVGSTKIAELKKASTALLNAMLTTANNGHVKIGFVPFASSVKVGPGYASASWLDTGGLTSINGENFDTNKKRLELFDRYKSGMRNIAWAGCVESRPIKVAGVDQHYDINDATPTTAKPDTLFVPWFAPDEPDYTDSYGAPYTNNYLDDDGGSCSSTASSQSTRQKRVCKYNNTYPDTSYGRGPNYMCDSAALTPLTSNRATLDAAVTMLDADGNTNVGEGLAWGWRLLSPSLPFSEGAAYNTPNLNKVIILMTDGQNNIPGRDTQNNSVYSSYGYIAKNRIGTTSQSSSTIRTKMDERLLLACTKAKAAGIIIYTVALGSDADADLLKTCATKSSYAYAPTTGAELTPVFQQIAASINKLRIAQ